jgi:hypothetical protein
MWVGYFLEKTRQTNRHKPVHKVLRSQTWRSPNKISKKQVFSLNFSYREISTVIKFNDNDYGMLFDHYPFSVN